MNKLIESDPDSEEAKKEFAIEANPFFNYTVPGGYLDFGILLELARAGMKSTHTRWNSVSQADQPGVLWSSTPSSGWSSSYEKFSQGSEWFFATGFEAGASVPVYKRLSLLTKLTVLRKYTRTEKLYGQSEIPEGGSSYVFHQTHKRNNYRNETWMTGRSASPTAGVQSRSFSPHSYHWLIGSCRKPPSATATECSSNTTSGTCGRCRNPPKRGCSSSMLSAAEVPGGPSSSERFPDQIRTRYLSDNSLRHWREPPVSKT